MLHQEEHLSLKMEKKANKFVALLCKRLINENFDEDDWACMFEEAVKSLADGKLKMELLQNLVHQDTFIRKISVKADKVCEKRTRRVGKDMSSQLVPSDKEKVQSPQKTADTLKPPISSPSEEDNIVTCSQQYHPYHQLSSQRLHDLDPEDELFHQWKESLHKGVPRDFAMSCCCCKSCQVNGSGSRKEICPELCRLCSLCCGAQHSAIVVNAMYSVLSHLQDEVEVCISKKKTARCRKLREELQNMFIFFHVKWLSVQNKRKISASTEHKYEDVLSSLLSLYVDLTLTVWRTEENQSKLGRQLCGFVNQLLSSWPGKVMEVLLQLSALTSGDEALILPLARKCLVPAPSKPDAGDYSRYMLCVRSVVAVFGEQSADIHQVARLLKAPKCYLDWLREQNPDILREIPEDRKFRGRIVTKFLLEDADQRTVEQLMDLLTEQTASGEITVCDVGGEWEENGGSCPARPDPSVGDWDQPLFYMDPAGDQSSQIHSQKEAENDVEVIEVDLVAFSMERDVQPAAWEGEEVSEDEWHIEEEDVHSGEDSKEEEDEITEDAGQSDDLQSAEEDRHINRIEGTSREYSHSDLGIVNSKHWSNDGDGKESEDDNDLSDTGVDSSLQKNIEEALLEKEPSPQKYTKRQEDEAKIVYSDMEGVSASRQGQSDTIKDGKDGRDLDVREVDEGDEVTIIEIRAPSPLSMLSGRINVSRKRGGDVCYRVERESSAALAATPAQKTGDIGVYNMTDSPLKPIRPLKHRHSPREKSLGSSPLKSKSRVKQMEESRTEDRVTHRSPSRVRQTSRYSLRSRVDLTEHSSHDKPDRVPRREGVVSVNEERTVIKRIHSSSMSLYCHICDDPHDADSLSHVTHCDRRKADQLTSPSRSKKKKLEKEQMGLKDKTNRTGPLSRFEATAPSKNRTQKRSTPAKPRISLERKGYNFRHISNSGPR